MTPRHPAVLNPVDSWNLIYTYPMRGIENKDGQLISGPSVLLLMRDSTTLCTQLHCTPNGSYAYLHQIAIKSTSLGH